MRPRVGWFVLLFWLLAWYTGPGISLCKAQTFGPWSNLVHVDYPINTDANDTYAILSKDGLTMYFASDRPGTHGGLDLWVAKRDSLNPPDNRWHGLGTDPLPTNMTALNTAVEDSLPALSSDEHVMFFHSTRPGGCGAGDIWMTRRQDTRTEDWEPPTNLGCVLNTEATEIAPAFFENPETGEVTLYYGSNRHPDRQADFDVYASPVGEDGYFGPGVLQSDLSSPGRDTRIFIRKDGLEVFITSDRSDLPGGQGLIDIWTSTRATLADAWPTPVNVGSPVNSAANDGSPWLSKDGTTLYFFSNRTGGFGGRDIYYVTRVKIGGE